MTFIANGIGNEVEVAQPEANNPVSPASIEKLQKILLKQSKEIEAGQRDKHSASENNDDDDDKNNKGNDEDDDNDDKDGGDDDSDDDDDEDDDDDDDDDDTNAKREKRNIEGENDNNDFKLGEDKNFDNDKGVDQQDIRNDHDGDNVITEDATDTFSSDYIRKKRAIRKTDESATHSEPKKEEYDVKIGSLNNQNMDIDIKQTKDGKIIDIKKGPVSLNAQTTVPPTSHGKQSKRLTMPDRSTQVPKVYSTKAKEYRKLTSSEAPTSMIPAAKVIMTVPRKLLENAKSKYCKFRASL